MHFLDQARRRYWAVSDELGRVDLLLAGAKQFVQNVSTDSAWTARMQRTGVSVVTIDGANTFSAPVSRAALHAHVLRWLQTT
jgi:hypothetical protein